MVFRGSTNPTEHMMCGTMDSGGEALPIMDYKKGGSARKGYLFQAGVM